MNPPIPTFFLVSCMIALVACGQSGPLYLPTHHTPLAEPTVECKTCDSANINSPLDINADIKREHNALIE